MKPSIVQGKHEEPTVGKKPAKSIDPQPHETGCSFQNGDGWRAKITLWYVCTAFFDCQLSMSTHIKFNSD